jgi:pyruvate formate lyase activating enzyme
MENISETAHFIKSLRDGIVVELLPYHRLGLGKYQTLDKPYLGEDLAAPEAEYIELVKRAFEELGVPCTISS